MWESLRRELMTEDFPEVTFILAAVIFAVFLFTRTQIDFYETAFGFIPARPQIYTLVTYLFVHANFTHVVTNLIFLIIGGLALEEAVGPTVFTAIFFVSGFFAVMFDILGRFLTAIFNVMSSACLGPFLSCVNFGGPFIGASGAIFGVMAVASMVKPFEKVPTLLVLLAFIPLAQIYYEYQMNLNYFTTILVTSFLALVAFAIYFISPATIPIIAATVAFLVSWIFIILLNASGGVSNVGHLGGIIGGIVAYFLFAKSKRT